VSARRAGTQAVNRARGGVSARTWTTSRPLATSRWRSSCGVLPPGRTPQLELRSSAVVTAGETALGKALGSPSAQHKRSNKGCNVEPQRAPRVRLAATAPTGRPVTFARGTVVACACTSPLFAAHAREPDRPAQTWARREGERAERQTVAFPKVSIHVRGTWHPARAGPKRPPSSNASNTQACQTARKRHFQVLCAKEAAAAGKSWAES
jgi:hypothetical protein